MRKKPDNLRYGGAVRFDNADPDKPGHMVFEIRLGFQDDGKFLWHSGVDEDFAESCKGESEEWRTKVKERMLFMAEQSITKALGLVPQ